MEVVAHAMHHQVQEILMQFKVFLATARAKFIRNGGAAIQAGIISAVMFFHSRLSITEHKIKQCHP